MSLINDALKRVSQIDPAKAPAMEILEPVPSAPPSRLPLIILPLIFVAALGLGVWFLLRGWEVTRQASRNQAQMTVAARAPATDNQLQPPLPSPASTPTVPGTPAAATVPVTVETVAPVDLVPTFPKLRLQAVFYRERNPSVMVNNRSLWIGDKVDEAVVVGISREAAIVEWRGEQRELKLP